MSDPGDNEKKLAQKEEPVIQAPLRGANPLAAPGVPRNQGARVQLQIAAEESFEGPLPDSRMMAGYAAIDSALPGRITTMAEKEADHRHKIERWVVLFNGFTSILAMVFGLLVVLGSFVLAGYIGVKLHPLAGAALGLGEVVALATVYLKTIGNQQPPPEEEPEKPKKQKKR